MSSSHHLYELDSATDSVASSPRSEHHASQDGHIRVRFMCSFGGKILPRPHDNQLRYVGGDTRIVAFHRFTSFSSFITKLSKLSGIGNVSVKYQFPNEDLDALISVTTDEDLENMMEEHDRLAQNQNPRQLARLRLFLFSNGDHESRASSISSLLDGSVNRENWFLDALNGGAAAADASRLERLRSEASSIVSEVPDYLFGLENSDEIQPRDPKLRTRQLLHDNNSVSDPGSPAPVVSSSPFCSASSATVVPSVTKPDNPEPVLKSNQSQTDSFVEQPVSQPTTYSGTPMWHHYVPDSHYSAPAVQQIPVYYVPGHVQPGNHQGQAQPVQIRTQYVQQYPNSSGQVPVGYHQQVHGAGQTYGQAPPVDPYDPTWNVAHDEKQPVYYGVRNSGPMQVYPGMVVPGGIELGRSRSDVAQGRISRSGQ